jgi:hypothetical protein
MANNNYRKAKAKKEKESLKNSTPPNEEREIGVDNNGDNGFQEATESEYLVDTYVPKKKRPTYRLPLARWMPSIPLIGKKVCARFLYMT